MQTMATLPGWGKKPFFFCAMSTSLRSEKVALLILMTGAQSSIPPMAGGIKLSPRKKALGESLME